ncbi:UNVERIFIED_CONTAM: hypothetical protein HDU68_000589, partial [Siphonaria sp. JEL0065]
FALVLARGLPAHLVQGIMVSLLNTALVYDPVGWGLVPYTHYLSFGSGDALMEQLVTLCLETLVALADLGAVVKLDDLTVERGTLVDLVRRAARARMHTVHFAKENAKSPVAELKPSPVVEKLAAKPVEPIVSSPSTTATVKKSSKKVVQVEEEDDEEGSDISSEEEERRRRRERKERKKREKEAKEAAAANGEEYVKKKKSSKDKDKEEKKEKKEKKKEKKEKESTSSSSTAAAEPASPIVETARAPVPAPAPSPVVAEAEKVVEETPVVSSPVLPKIVIDKSAWGNNDFRYFLSKISKKEDLELLWSGIVRMLKNPLESAGTLLPGANKRVSVHVEVIMLFWKFYEVNANFAALVKDSDKVLQFTATLIYFMIESRENPSKEQQFEKYHSMFIIIFLGIDDIGLVRMACFILHLLSQERNYAIQLNAPFDNAGIAIASAQLPIFTGCWADFVVLGFHYIITTTSKTPVASLHETMLMTLSNLSPYLKNLCVVTGNKLLSLFQVFTNPAFLVSSEGNHKMVFYLLDFFNSVVQYQIGGNSQLVYALVRNRDRIHALNKLTFENAVNELAKVRAARAKKLAGNADGVEAAVVHENKFQATEEWFNYWKSHVRLGVLLTLVDALGPAIEAYCVEKGFNDDKKAIEYLASGTTVGLLPLPQPIFTRKFSYTEAVRVWFTSYMWGNVYIKCANPVGGAEVIKMCPSIWTGTEVELFSVKITEG